MFCESQKKRYHVWASSMISVGQYIQLVPEHDLPPITKPLSLLGLDSKSRTMKFQEC